MENRTKENMAMGLIVGTSFIIILLYLFGDMIVDWLFHKLLC